MFDMHSHILWDMDDGAKSIEQSIAMGSIAFNEGVHTIVATPHFVDVEDPQLFLANIDNKIGLLKPSLHALGIDIEILKGAEVYMDPGILEMDILNALTLGNSRYILVEMPAFEVPMFARDVFYQLQLKGLIPVIAHPERNSAIINDPNVLYDLVDAGCLTQITSGSLYGLFGSHVRACAKVLVTHDMVHMIGTDAHSEGRRGPYMKRAKEVLIQWAGDEKAEDILFNTPDRLLKNEKINIPPPKKYKRKRFWFFK